MGNGKKITVDEAMEAAQKSRSFPKMLVQLAEAVSGDRATFDLVLEAAVEQKVELLFETPLAPKLVISLSKGELDPPCIGSLSNMFCPEYLALRSGYCKGLLSKSAVSVFDSAYGYQLVNRYTIDQPVHPIDRVKDAEFPLEWKDDVSRPPLGTPSLADRWWHKEGWAFWEGGMPFPHTVRREDLFIVGSDFSRLMGWGENPLTNQLVDDPVRRYVSQKLMALRQAAVAWQKAYGGKNTTEISQREADEFNRKSIIPSLRKAFGGRSALTEAAASMVRPVWARDKRSTRFPHTDITVELYALYEAQRLWHKATLDRSSWPSNAEVIDVFMSVLGKFGVDASQNVKDCAAAILRPEDAEDGRHTKQPAAKRSTKAN